MANKKEFLDDVDEEGVGLEILVEQWKAHIGVGKSNGIPAREFAKQVPGFENFFPDSRNGIPGTSEVSAFLNRHKSQMVGHFKIMKAKTNGEWRYWLQDVRSPIESLRRGRPRKEGRKTGGR